MLIKYNCCRASTLKQNILEFVELITVASCTHNSTAIY